MVLRRGERAMIGVSPEVRDDLADLRDERGDQNLNQTVERLLYGEDNA